MSVYIFIDCGRACTCANLSLCATVLCASLSARNVIKCLYIFVFVCMLSYFMINFLIYLQIHLTPFRVSSVKRLLRLTTRMRDNVWGRGNDWWGVGVRGEGGEVVLKQFLF